MVKAYLRYEHAQCFGVVASTSGGAPVVSVCGNGTAREDGADEVAARLRESRLSERSATWDPAAVVVAPGLEAVNVWHARKGTLIKQLAPSTSGDAGEVTSLISLEDGKRVAAGYSNGSIKTWNLADGANESSLHGHKTAVSALSCWKGKSLLASGGRDSDIVVWDLVAETGLFRLKGHKNEVTSLCFLAGLNALASGSKDATLRIWNLESQHCEQVVTCHKAEVWTMSLSADQECLVTGSVDEEMTCFRVAGRGERTDSGEEVLVQSGAVRRSTRGRAQQVAFAGGGGYFGAIGQGKVFELFRVRDGKEARKKAKRRAKRKREKAAEGGARDEDSAAGEQLASDALVLEGKCNTKHKIKSFAFHRATPGNVRVVLALQSNAIELHDWDGTSFLRAHSLDAHGHRGDIRSLCVSHDGSMVLSCSQGAAKVWNARTGNCVLTSGSGFGLCSAFVNGDRYAVVGTRAGALEILDVGAGRVVGEVDAHEDAVWGLAAAPDGTGLVSVGGDGGIKFWSYAVTDAAEGEGATAAGGAHLTLQQTRVLKMPEDVLCVKIDAAGKYVAVGMIDSSIKVFFLDSLKFSLSLYGHKLPVLCLDISSDGALVVSGSADKNVKIWGLDFGDCHKSLFGHADSVTQVRFVPKTHYFFSTGKDRMLKYWDADKFELLLELSGHHAEVWALGVSPLGDFVVTGSHDRSLRRWERTEESFFLEEEKERRLETMFDSVLDEDRAGDGAQGGSAAAGQKNQQTVTAADKIIEAVMLAENELERLAEKPANFVPNPLLLGLSPHQYVLNAVKAVRSSDIEQALIMLPFSDAVTLLGYAEHWLGDSLAAELTCRVVMTLVRIHVDQLSATHSVRPQLVRIQGRLRPEIAAMKSLVGTNVAGVQFLRSERKD